MKKYIILSSLVACIMSCDDVLNKYPQTEISTKNFWQTEADFKMAANALYNSLENNHQSDIDLQSDDYYGRSVNDISAGTLVASNTDDVWTDAYTAVRKANDIIENAEVSEVEVTVKECYAAEARFFRAYQYAKLIKRFGDVPLIVHTLDMSSPELYEGATQRSLVVEKIIEDLEWASDKLPRKQDLASTNEGRITRGAALALLSRVALYEGTFRKYHNKGDFQELLSLAKSTAAIVITEGEFSLYPDFLEVFKEKNEGNAETILRTFYKETITSFAPRTRALILDANIAPTKNLADAFLCMDGLPIEYSPLFEGYGDISTEFMNRDPRMSYTIWEPLTPYENNAPLIPELFRARTGYWPKKPGDIMALEKTFVYTDYIIMRYAEVLLNYAEATFELEGSISDTDLNMSINKLRERVGMKSLTNAFISEQTAKGYSMNMLDEIRRERRVELAGEGYRYDDIIRWKVAENVLPREIKGVKFQQSYYENVVPGKDVQIDKEGFIIVEKSEARTFEPSKNYLFPLPLRELSLNNKLTQNPGWD